jgi:hypothetical protein
MDRARDDYVQKKGIHVHQINMLRHTASSAVHEILNVLSFGS